MSTADFLDDPWSSSHSAYEGSPLQIRPAPEFSTGEVVVASLIRAVGFASVSEGDVPRQGREFDKAARAARGRDTDTAGVQPELWRAVLHGILESPKQPSQSAKRFVQLSPVVPDTALYSGSARLSGNSWNPGMLVARMIRLGCDSEEEARALWSKVFDHLSVVESDDVWARWLDSEFRARRRVTTEWTRRKLELGADFHPSDKARVSDPARRFVRDFETILDAKGSMTRRQWTSLIEAVLRLGTVSHVLWLCHVNHLVWAAVEGALRGNSIKPFAAEAALTGKAKLLSFGNPAITHIKELTSRYLAARLGLNAVLWRLQDGGHPVARLAAVSDFQALIELAGKERQGAASGVLETVAQLRETQVRTLSCKKGIGANLVEFSRHVLGQRQTANEALRGYDQGYFLRKRGEHASAPWVVSLGPVAVLALVHCCLRGSAGPSSIQRLSAHLEEYGLDVDRDDIASSELGLRLRTLGLVLDSPDAESGMLLVDPFSDSVRSTGVTQ